MDEQIVFAEVSYVWPGVIIDVLKDKVVLSLVRISDETQEDHSRRCQDVVNYACNKSRKPKPSVIDFSDTTKFKQVGPNTYEAITPGDQPIDKTE